MSDETSAEPTTAAEVRDRLHGRWPDSEYLHIEEAPEDSGRQGRKIDVLVVSLWRSRGLAVDAVEVKVSMSDFRTEIKNVHKADFWWEHSDRFWVAMPASLTAKAKNELPPGWGLIGCTATGTKIIVQAERHDRKPMGWETTVGVVRATAGAGISALSRARDAGRSQGYQEGIRHAESGGDGRLRDQLTKLRDQVAAFQEASGLEITTYSDGRRLGEMVALVQKVAFDPIRLPDRVHNDAARLRAMAKTIDDLADVLAQALVGPEQLAVEVSA